MLFTIYKEVIKKVGKCSKFSKISKKYKKESEEVKMKRLIYNILLIVVFMITGQAIACEPPTCGVIVPPTPICCPAQGEGYINTTEKQHQEWNNTADGKKVTSTFFQSQTQTADGKRISGNYTGDAKIDSQQFYTDEKTWQLGDGAYTKQFESGYQELRTSGEIAEKCDALKIDAANNYTGKTVNDQGPGFMHSEQSGNELGKIYISGEPGRSSGYLEGKHQIYYDNQDANGNWQTGSITTNQKISINPSAPPQD